MGYGLVQVVYSLHVQVLPFLLQSEPELLLIGRADMASTQLPIEDLPRMLDKVYVG